MWDRLLNLGKRKGAVEGAVAGWNIFHKYNFSVICIKLTINGNVSCCYRYLHNLILISQALFNYISWVKSLKWLQFGFWSLTGQEKLKLSGCFKHLVEGFPVIFLQALTSELTSPQWPHLTWPNPYCCLCVVKLKPSPCPPAVLSKAQLSACVLCNLAKSSWLTHGMPSCLLQGPQSGQLSTHRFGHACSGNAHMTTFFIHWLIMPRVSFQQKHKGRV